jgi:hypothetical protein
MIQRTPSGEAIGSTKPKSQVIDPTCWPSLETSGPAKLGQYKLELLPSFPRTLFEFRKYDGAKALTAFLLILAAIYFLLGFLGFVVDHTPWLKALFHKPPIPDTSPKSYGGSSGKRSAQLSPTSRPMSISSFDCLSLSVPTA